MGSDRVKKGRCFKCGTMGHANKPRRGKTDNNVSIPPNDVDANKRVIEQVDKSAELHKSVVEDYGKSSCDRGGGKCR